MCVLSSNSWRSIIIFSYGRITTFHKYRINSDAPHLARSFSLVEKRVLLWVTHTSSIEGVTDFVGRIYRADIRSVKFIYFLHCRLMLGRSRDSCVMSQEHVFALCFRLFLNVRNPTFKTGFLRWIWKFLQVLQDSRRFRSWMLRWYWTWVRLYGAFQQHFLLPLLIVGILFLKEIHLSMDGELRFNEFIYIFVDVRLIYVGMSPFLSIILVLLFLF